MSAPVAVGSVASPWSVAGRFRLIGFVAVGAAAIVAGWFFAAGRNDPGDQLIFVSLGLFGLACEMSGVGRWIGDGRRSVGSFRRQLLGVAVSRFEQRNVPAERPSSPDLVGRSGGRWIHRPDCPLVRGRQWESFPAGSQPRAGRQACPACRP